MILRLTGHGHTPEEKTHVTHTARQSREEEDVQSETHLFCSCVSAAERLLGRAGVECWTDEAPSSTSTIHSDLLKHTHT